MAVTYKEEFDLNDLSFEDVINGLNKYFAEDETRVRVPRSYVEITSHNKVFYRFDAAMYVDKLIAWLRTEHGIFYYPGMEAKYAKTERIPPLTERLMDNGALNSLKKLYKRVTGEEPEVDSHTLIADGISDEIVKMRGEIKSKESGIEDLKEHIALLEADLKKVKMEKEKFLIEVADREEEIEALQNKDYDVYLEHRQYIIKSIMCNIRQDASRNGFALPEKVDGEPLSIERTFHDLLELLMKRTTEIKEVNDKRWKDLRDIHKALGCDGMNGRIDDFAKTVKARAEYVESLSRNTERSDINKLISDHCNKFDIIAPSPDSSDKSCVEYLFSVVDLERKHRAAVGKQMVEDYEKDLLKFIYKEYGNRTHLSDKTITYDPQSVRNTIIKIISDYARSRTRVDVLEERIKSIFDEYKTKFTVDDHVINGDPSTRFMLDCIWSWIGSSTELKERCNFLEDDLSKTAVIREFLNRRNKTRTKLGTIEKKLEELLKDIREELP